MVKPAEQTPLVVGRLVEFFHQVGVPRDVLQFVPGQGETVGAALVKSEQTAMVAFTGSREVGMEILKESQGRVYHNKRENISYPVKVVTEMGGKNGVIVASNADLDEAVSGIVFSAYEHAGQKCSACSRVIVDERVAPKFLERFTQACQDIFVGPAHLPHTRINPLITSFEKERVLGLERDILAEAQAFGGTVHVNRLAEEGLAGNCVGPLVVELPRQRAYAQDSFARRELFAPVVHVMTYQNLHQACDLFNATPYGLTGGVYAQSQDDVDFLTATMKCGNIYVNRPNTGARVGIEPFGGCKLSGTGPKAGSPHYTTAFTVHKKQLSVLSPSPVGLAPPSRLSSPAPALPFSPPPPSAACAFDRVHSVRKGLEKYLRRNHGQGKEALAEFSRWLQAQAVKALEMEHPHISIPGQLSYSNWKMPKEFVLVAAGRPHPHYSSILSFLAALVAGSGVEVVSDSPPSLSFWREIAHDIVSCGFAPESVRWTNIASEDWEVLLGHSKLAACLFDMEFEQWQQLSARLYQTEPGEHVKLIYHPSDAPPLDRPEDYLGQFVETRAFAVNTMRYGASLEVEF